MTLEEIWNELKQRISTKGEVPVWSAEKGYLGERFTIAAVRDGHVQVAELGASQAKRIPDQDFIAVLAVWGDYADGDVDESEIDKKTKFAKYVISILRSLEQPWR
jgi:hypothetical protein